MSSENNEVIHLEDISTDGATPVKRDEPVQETVSTETAAPVQEAVTADELPPLQPESQEVVHEEAEDELTDMTNAVARSGYKANSYEVKHEWSRKPTEAELNTPAEMVPLPTASKDFIERLAALIPKEPPDEESKAWFNALVASTLMNYSLGRFSETVNRDGADFVQKVAAPNGDELGIRTPRIAQTSDPSKFTGKKAATYIRQKIGLGNYKKVPLWKTGIWVTINKPSEADLIDLNLRTMERKRELGRRTMGMAFNNTRTLTTGPLLEFIKEKITATTFAGDSVDLFDVICMDEIPALVTGLAAVVYSKGGFRYETQCAANPTDCTAQIVQLADPTLMLWTDQSQLDEYQRNFMSNSMKQTTTQEMVNIYRSHFKVPRTKKIVIDKENGISAVLKMPTINESIQMGANWVNDIERLATTALAIDATDGERDRYAARQAAVTILRSYEHFIESIETDGVTISDPDQLKETLNDMSVVGSIRNDMLDEIGKFIDSSTLSLCCTTDFVCPHCGGTQIPQELKDGKTRRSELIVVDPETVFFALLGWRVQLYDQIWTSGLERFSKSASTNT
jgi:hypothetical protein